MLDYAKDPTMNGVKDDGTKIKVMIVDDSLAIRRLLEKILIDHQYDVVGQAENGEEAVGRYGECKPEVVLMDITMPVMSGIDALTKIIAADKNARVVMLTAIGADTEVKAAIKAGAKNYIVKPITEDVTKKILKVLKELCK